MEADVARACDLPQKRRTTGREIEAKYGTYRDGARRVNVHTILSKRAHIVEKASARRSGASSSGRCPIRYGQFGH